MTKEEQKDMNEAYRLRLINQMYGLIELQKQTIKEERLRRSKRKALRR